MASRVLLHVGTPKTGTSAVQHALFTERDRLREDGVLYPGERFDAHFLAALDLMQLPWGGLEREAHGAWDALVAEVRAWPGTAIISHEILGRASRLQVRRALDGFGDTPVELVLSARDLCRQLPAEWQENVKHRRTLGFADFLDAVRDPDSAVEVAQWFWGVQDVPAVLERWAADLPTERVRLVTVPPSGSPRHLLGARFAAAFGLAEEILRPRPDRANASLGVAESALIRALNERLDLVLPNQHYRQFVREGLVHQDLGTHRASARLTLPADVHAWARGLGIAWTERLAAGGYDVIGDLADLVPEEQPPPFVDPDHADPEEVLEAALRALAASVQESARLREVELHLHRDIQDLMGQLDAAHSTRLYKAKERLVSLADTNSAARAGLAVYRRLRGRNSRPT